MGAPLITYDDGNRLEDIMGTIVTISPTETPFMSSIRKGKASNTLHQWIRDTITTRQDNAVVEGSAFSYSATSVPTRANNVTQIFSKDVSVSSTEKWVKQAGLSNMYEYDLAKKLKAISTDIEHALLRGSKATGNTTVARRLAGVLNYISTNVTAVVSGTKLTEAFYIGQIENAWIAGGNPDETYVNSKLKKVISAFSEKITKNINAEDKKFIQHVAEFESDFGTQRIFLSRDIPSDSTGYGCTLLVIENARWKMAIGEPVHELSKEEVAQTIHGQQGIVRGELTLEALAEEANSVATGLSHLPSA